MSGIRLAKLLLATTAAMVLLGAGPASAAVLKADYRFQDSRSSSVGTAAPLTDVVSASNPPNEFVTESVDGASRRVLRFPKRNGLSMATTGVVSSSTYSLVLLFNFDQLGAFRKVVDFRNGTNDSGLYTFSGGSTGPAEPAFYSKTSGGLYYDDVSETHPIATDDYVQVTMTRDAAKLVRVYVEGVQRFSFTDTFNEAVVGPAGNLRFFVDDADTGGSESAAGAVSRLRVYDGVLTASEVAGLSRAPQPAGCDFPGAVQGTSGGETLTGSPTNDDLICAGAGNDTLRGEGGDDRLLGEGGDDVLDGGTGADEMSGGDGTDRVSYNGRVSAVTVSIGAGTGDDGAAGEGDTVQGDVEDVRGGAGNDTLTGDDDANLLLGEGGDDDLFGQGGADDLRGDSSNAQAGADEVHGGLGNDALRGYDGSDQHFGEAGNDTVYSDAGADLLSGGEGIDSAYYAGRAGELTVTVGSGTGDDGGVGEGDTVQGDVEKVSGGSGSDQLTGNANPLGTVLLGGAGDDTLGGGGGPKDLLSGDAGDDSLNALDLDSSDTLSCGSGIDTNANDPGDLVKGDCEGAPPPT